MHHYWSAGRGSEYKSRAKKNVLPPEEAEVPEVPSLYIKTKLWVKKEIEDAEFDKTHNEIGEIFEEIALEKAIKSAAGILRQRRQETLTEVIGHLDEREQQKEKDILTALKRLEKIQDTGRKLL